MLTLVHDNRKELSAETFFDLALSIEESNPEGALKYYRKAWKLSNGKLYESAINAGRLFAEHGNSLAAIRAFKSALKVNPSNAVSWFNLACCYHDTGKFQQAEFAYRKALQINPNFYDARYNLQALKEHCK